MQRKITKRKRNKAKKKNWCKLKAIAHHSPTGAQPVSEQQAPGQLSLQFICWAWCFMVWNIPLALWGQLFWLCSLTALCALPAYSLADYEKLESPWLSASTAEQQPNQECAINISLILKLKHSTVPANREKIDIIPDDTRTTWKNKMQTKTSWGSWQVKHFKNIS